MDALPGMGLPAGWASATLGELCDIIGGITVDAKRGGPGHAEVPYLRVANVQRGRLDLSKMRDILVPQAKLDALTLQHGDVLLNEGGDRDKVGRGWVWEDQLPQCVFQNHVFRARVRDDVICPFFLSFYLNEFGRAYFLTGAKQTTNLASISLSAVKGAPVIVPPRAEQARIVAAVNALFEEVEAGEAALARAREGLTQFRASLLHAACTGALTADWRAANPTNETGEEVVRASLQRAGAVAQGRALRAESSAMPDNLPELPPSWRWARFWQLCHVTGGITVDAKRSGDDLVDVPYLRVANVQRGRLDLETVKSLKASPDQIARLLLRPNDVLLNEGGDRDKLGRGWVWDGQIEPCIHQNHVFRARPYVPELDGRFISHYLNELGRSYFFSNATQTVNLASISLRAVLGTPIPVPPLAEIAEIMKRTADLETSVSVPMVPDGVGAQLRQSILHAAFTGRLVPQDPADEPAAALLARLRAVPAAARRPRGRRAATQPDLIETPA